MRMQDKVVIVVGAGQSPGQGMGNGRAACVLFAREGAKILAVDRDGASAEETAKMIRDAGGDAQSAVADVVDEASLAAAIAQCMSAYGRVDTLHNNVGISVAGGDADPLNITEAAFDLIMSVNLRGTVMACKHVLPIMREQRTGCIINISSLAAIENYPWVAYKASKSAMIAFTEQVAIQNAPYGVRANSILPGLMDTPMAVDTRANAWGRPREEIAAERDARVPLRNKMGTSMDVAHAALYLASDEASFVTGVALRVDGGAGINFG